MSTEQDWLTKAYDEIAASQREHNANVKRINDRIYRALSTIKGPAFVKNLQQLLTDCECGGTFGFMDVHEIVRSVEGLSFNDERYGRHIKGYWVDQWAVGDSGDSWTGFIYVELKPGRYLKTPFQM